MPENRILLGHGSGGKLSHDLVSSLFLRSFDNPVLARADDSAVLADVSGRVAFSTDSYVINPIFFPGGDIGKLAVCGTVNDLAMAGAEPRYLSASFMLEEGLPLTDLERIVASMAQAAREAGVTIVAGDTKVVERGAADETAYFHFTLSNLGFGILAATVSFFLLTHGVTRVLLPRLIEPGDVDAARVEQMRRLRRRVPFYFAACTAVPFLSVIVLATQSHQLEDLGGAFLVLGLLGALAFAATLALGAWIRRDLGALMRALAVRPERSGPRP